METYKSWLGTLLIIPHNEVDMERKANAVAGRWAVSAYPGKRIAREIIVLILKQQLDPRLAAEEIIEKCVLKGFKEANRAAYDTVFNDIVNIIS